MFFDSELLHLPPPSLLLSLFAACTFLLPMHRVVFHPFDIIQVISYQHLDNLRDSDMLEGYHRCDCRYASPVHISNID